MDETAAMKHRASDLGPEGLRALRDASTRIIRPRPLPEPRPVPKRPPGPVRTTPEARIRRRRGAAVGLPRPLPLAVRLRDSDRAILPILARLEGCTVNCLVREVLDPRIEELCKKHNVRREP